MGKLSIQFADERRAFNPCEKVEGTVSWEFNEAPETIFLNLLWYTEGKGDPEAEIVRSIPFENPAAHESRPFSVYLPRGPYSFSGKLIAIHWTLELIANPGRQFAFEEIVISPTGREIRPQE